MEKKAVYPGSFDPFTNGHMDIVRKASAIFDRVYIVMAVNSEKRRAFDCRRMQEAMERALRIYNGKPLVNSVNGKEESLHTVLPLVKSTVLRWLL